MEKISKFAILKIWLPPPPFDGDTLEALPQQEQFYRAPARFGSIPVEAEPKGWDRRQGFRKLYPRIDLPTQIVEQVSLGATEDHKPNRLIWGDNLHVMRSIPSNTVDLIYIDPPFFSERHYNVLWGDKNELRSFTDIWEGGLDGYLVWLNARLYEMKRILKPTGSIYVHCDWHASHYIKVEMDKIFGHDNFRNEIIWSYKKWTNAANYFQRNSDTILFYTKTSSYFFNKLYTDDMPEHKKKGWHSNTVEGGTIRQLLIYDRTKVSASRLNNPKYDRVIYLDDKPQGIALSNVWEIPYLRGQNKENIGYPTQKPMALIKRIVEASSNKNDIIADFFVGGGTTASVAQKLGRRFIACDQSRVAIAVTAERLKQESMTLELGEEPRSDFTVEQWGIYEADRLSLMPLDDFRRFVLTCYGARTDDLEHIHGWRNQMPIWVGTPRLESQVTAQDVTDFANAIRRTEQYRQSNLRNGEMLAWGFRRDAVEAAEQLRKLEHVDVNFVSLAQIQIGDDRFRAHIIKHSTDRADYGDFLTFVRPPVVSVGWKTLGGKSVTFDASESAVVNPGAEIINVQWDFNHNGDRFTATPGYSFQRDISKALRVTHKFDKARKYRVACRVQDSMGGEGMWSGEVEVT